jgi:hypothetical protein
MERIVINPVQCIDKYQEDNRLIQSVMACGSGNKSHAIKPAHVHMVYEPIWLGKPWGLSYLKWKDAKEAQLERKGSKIIGAPFPMRLVQEDPLRLQSIVARTDGLLFFNWMLHRAKAILKERYSWLYARVVLAYEDLQFKTLFTHSVVQFPESYTGLYHATLHHIHKTKAEQKREFQTGDLIDIGSVLSRKKRVFVVGLIPRRLRVLVMRADGLHYLFGLWKLRKIRRNPQLVELLLEGSYPEITLEERKPSRWQSLWPKPRRGNEPKQDTAWFDDLFNDW